MSHLSPDARYPSQNQVGPQFNSNSIICSHSERRQICTLLQHLQFQLNVGRGSLNGREKATFDLHGFLKKSKRGNETRPRDLGKSYRRLNTASEEPH